MTHLLPPTTAFAARGRNSGELAMKLTYLAPTSALCCLALAAPSVWADVQTVTATLTSSGLLLAPWTQTATVPRFDASLGNLDQVRVELRGTARGRIGFENLGAAVPNALLPWQSRIEVQGPGSFTTSVVVLNPVMVSAQPYDGHLDYVGASGATFLNQVGRETVISNASALAAWTTASGTGLISLALSGANTTPVLVSVPVGGPVRLTSRVSSDALVTVTYVYTPIQDCDDDGIPDANEPDADADGFPDDCDVEPQAPVALPSYARPGSLLVFPIANGLDVDLAGLVLHTLTNTSSIPVLVNVVHVNSDAGCSFFNFTRSLGPLDTTTDLSQTLLPSGGRGYLYAYAVAAPPSTLPPGTPIRLDVLAGSSLVLSALDAYDYRVPAIAFRGATGDGSATDVDGDGIRDLDGIEYEPAPDELDFPRFRGQSATFASDLVLINLTGGVAFTAIAGLEVYNDDGSALSAQRAFSCWSVSPLSALGNAFDNGFLQSGGDPLEILGNQGNTAGWFRVRGLSATSTTTVLDDPALLGVLVERSNGAPACEFPFYVGVQANGGLLPIGTSDDVSEGRTP